MRHMSAKLQARNSWIMYCARVAKARARVENRQGYRLHSSMQWCLLYDADVADTAWSLLRLSGLRMNERTMSRASTIDADRANRLD